ncbi:MAG TPA: transaldolase [Thermomicrobiales bacterium]|nr:transaldolase [Thermomicrobiales bacterium]
MAENRIQQLLALGQSVWQDDISREMLQNGEIQRRIDEGVRGLTSNPSIFEKAIAGGTAYDEQIAQLLRQGLDPAAIFEALSVRDIQQACDLFRPIYDASGGHDGFVSIEVSPGAARDTERTRREAKRLWDEVGRPNVFVKIPGTVEGAPVVEEMLESGVNINITLLFSIAAYERVAHAYVNALKSRRVAGKPVARVASVASFFVSRVDTLVDKLLDQKIAAATSDADKAKLEKLKGKAAIANAKLAYQRFQEIFSGDDWEALAAQGAATQRPLWASTSVKNPAYPDVLYVDHLIGPETVNTMPRATIEAFLDHGVVARTVDRDLEAPRQTMADLAAAGIDMTAVTDQLENEGIAAFAKSYESLLAGVEAKRAKLAEMVEA